MRITKIARVNRRHRKGWAVFNNLGVEIGYIPTKDQKVLNQCEDNLEHLCRVFYGKQNHIISIERVRGNDGREMGEKGV